MSHPLVKIARSLAGARGRRKHGLVLVEGMRAVEGAVAAGVTPRAAFMTREAAATRRGEALVLSLSRAGCAVNEVPASVFRSISQVETPQGAAIMCPVKAFQLEDALKLNFVLVADGLQDPGNLGTIIRSAAAFGVEAVLLTKGTVDVRNPKVLRASAGIWLGVPVCESLDPDALGKSLASAGFRIIVADSGDGIDFRRENYHGRLALVVGSEPHGPGDILGRRANSRVRIPIRVGVESLNVAAAAAILLAQAAWRRSAGG